MAFRVRGTTTTILFLTLAMTPVQAADVTPAQYFAICDSTDMQAALVTAESFGWKRLSDAELDEWRNDYERFNSVAVQVASWRNGKEPDTQTVAFWIASGANAHRACTYNANRDAGLRQALIERFGEVADATPDLVYWALGKTQAGYTSRGSAVYVTIGVYQ